MADHNGDFSPEAERKRKVKREKMQRRRMRERIREGRASALERECIQAWEAGIADWEEIIQRMEEPEFLYDFMARLDVDRAQDSVPARPPRKKRAQDAQGGEEQKGGSWLGWVVGGFFAAIIGGAIWIGRHTPPPV